MLAADGMTSKDIAERLLLSVRTVDNHLQHVYAKLGVSSRAGLAQPWGATHDTRADHPGAVVIRAPRPGWSARRPGSTRSCSAKPGAPPPVTTGLALQEVKFGQNSPRPRMPGRDDRYGRLQSCG